MIGTKETNRMISPKAFELLISLRNVAPKPWMKSVLEEAIASADSDEAAAAVFSDLAGQCDTQFPNEEVFMNRLLDAADAVLA
jgi:hypothetical protein